jgi:SAM-dependent methyltransferase
VASSTAQHSETTETDQAKESYWDQYYASSADLVRPVPSQFSAFVSGELPGPQRLIEFGCGTGRDALFFASYGHQVIAIDASRAATERGAALAAEFGEQVDFIVADIDDPGLADLIPPGTGPTTIYARFFLHAITDDEEHAFLDCASKLTGPGDLMALEYRTVRDQSGAKATGRHYRRFINPADFQFAATERGFHARYSVEGFGFAKYKQDDAYVARGIWERV